MAEIIWVGGIEGIINMADFFTKTTTSIPTRYGIISKVFNNSTVIFTFYGGYEARIEAKTRGFPLHPRLQK